jgi:hypothetical protein
MLADFLTDSNFGREALRKLEPVPPLAIREVPREISHAYCGATKPVCECTQEDFDNRRSFVIGGMWDYDSITCAECRRRCAAGLPEPKFWREAGAR